MMMIMIIIITITLNCYLSLFLFQYSSSLLPIVSNRTVLRTHSWLNSGRSKQIQRKSEWSTVVLWNYHHHFYHVLLFWGGEPSRAVRWLSFLHHFRYTVEPQYNEGPRCHITRFRYIEGFFFSHILLLLGQRKSFVVARTSLGRDSLYMLYWGSTGWTHCQWNESEWKWTKRTSRNIVQRLYTLSERGYFSIRDLWVAGSHAIP